MDSNNSVGAVGGAGTTVLPPIEDMNIPPPNVPSEASFSEDPFADDFFQSSFGSQSAWPGSDTGEQVVDPFSSGASFEAAWGITAQDSTITSTSQAAGVVSSETADPFQEDLATPTGSGGGGGNQAAAAHDPFQDTTTPTSPPVSFDFAGFSAESPWNESLSSAVTTTTSSITQPVPTASFDEGFGSNWGTFSDTSVNTTSSNAAVSQSPNEQDSQQEPATILSSPPPQVTIPRRAEATSAQAPATVATSTVTAPAGPSPTAVPPPPLPKRDSGILKPPPVSPTRRADAISNRNQSMSSRSRPRPSAAGGQAQAPVVAAAAVSGSQVVLNRPPKSKSSPGQTRTYSSEAEPQLQQEFRIPSPDFGADAEVTSTTFDAMFDASDNNQESGDVSLTSSAMSDLFLQSGVPPASVPSSEPMPSSVGDPFQSVTSTSSAQADGASGSFQGALLPTSQADSIGELFQDSLPPSSITTSTSQVPFSDPFKGGTPQTSTATDQLSLGNPFQEVSPQRVPLSAAQQAPASDPFQDHGFPPASSESKATSGDPFGGVVEPSAGGHDPFPSSVQSPPASVQSQVGTATSQAKSVTSAPESSSEGGGGDWSGFGDMWSSKKQESATSSDWSAAFGSAGGTETAASKPQEPASNSAFDSQQKQQKEPAASSFSGFGDNWSGFPDQGKATNAPATSARETGSTPIVTTPSVSQGKSESSWNAFGQDSFSTPSTETSTVTAQSQPQVQQKQAKPAAAPGLLPPPSSKSNRPSGTSGSPLSTHSRPRARPTGDRGPGGSGGGGGLLNPPSSQKASGSSRGGQAQVKTAASGSSALSSNPLNKSEISTKKSGSYLEDLSSLSGPPSQQQPQFSPMNMSYPGAVRGGGVGGGPLFQQQQQQQPGGSGWGSPPPGPNTQSPPFSQQPPMQVPPPQQQQQQAFQSYGGPQGPPGGQSMPPQQQQQRQQRQQQQFMQQQQAMFAQQQQQAMQQMQRGPPGSMQQGPPGSMMQQRAPGAMPPGSMQQGPPGAMPPGSMQQGPPGAMQGGYANMQQQQIQMPPDQQQGAMHGGMQFSSPGGPQQMIGPPGQGGQMPGPPHAQFSTPQQQQQYYYQQQQHQQQQLQQNPNAFSPVAQPGGNPLTPGNASMGSGQYSGANLSTSHLNASGFSSPPYAVGSSTPQSGTPGTAPAADLPPPTVEYRPSVNDGRPDPFASLVTGALSPSKDGKVKGVDAEKLKAAFIKQPSPNKFPSPGPSYYGGAPNNPQGGWV